MENWTLPTNHAPVLLVSPATRGHDIATSRPPWHHQAQRLRHRHRPHRGGLRGQAESRPPQPLPDSGPPPAARAGQLAIRAERTPHHGDSEQVIVAERPQGSFTRQLSLGEGVDPENLTATYADGVLHLTIPVSPRTQARRVEITHAPGGSRTISESTVEPG